MMCCSHSLLLILDILELLRVLIIILIMMSHEAKQRASSFISRRTRTHAPSTSGAT